MEFMDMLAALAGAMTEVTPTDLWSSMTLKDLWLIFAATTGQIGSVWAYVLYRRERDRARQMVYIKVPKSEPISGILTPADRRALAKWGADMTELEGTGGIHTPRWEALNARVNKMTSKLNGK